MDPYQLIVFGYTGPQLQYDKALGSCCRFTLEHIFKISQIDIFTPLLKAKENGKISGEDYCFFNENNCPKELAVIFKYSQSISVIKNLPEHLKFQVINKKGENTKKSIKSHIEFFQHKGMKKKRNNLIYYKKDKLLSSINSYLNMNDDETINKILNSRQEYALQAQEEYYHKISPVKTMQQLLLKERQNMLNTLLNSDDLDIKKIKSLNKDIKYLEKISDKISTNEMASVDDLLQEIMEHKKLSPDTKDILIDRFTNRTTKQPRI